MTGVQKRPPHVYWIGGTGGAGKSAVSALLAERHGLQVYRFDESSARHTARATAERHPELLAFVAMSTDERWLLRSPEEMARNALAGWAERFELVLDDLLAMPAEPRIIAEGIALLPECVASVPGAARRAVWLVHTPAFVRTAEEARRGLTSMTAATSDPERALAKLMRRNELLAEHMRGEARRRGLRVVDVDDGLTLARAVEMVERAFGLGT